MPRLLSRNPTDKQILQIAEAIRKGDGLKSNAAKQLKVSRFTVYEWVEKYPEIAAAFEDAKESRLDFAESKLQQAIKKGQPWAICFYLKCQGKKRGYVERHEVTGADGGPLKQVYAEMSEDQLRALAGGGRRRARAPQTD